MSRRLETWPDRKELSMLGRHEEGVLMAIDYTRNEGAKEGGSGVASSSVDKRGAGPA